jgi:SAM-dependent methyltransferase
MGRKIQIHPEKSAQGMNARPNPFVTPSIDFLLENCLQNANSHLLAIADQGCGKLRHLKVFLKYFRKILLVDTEAQLRRTQDLGGQLTTVEEYVGSLGSKYPRLKSLPAKLFARSKLRLDVIFNTCVFDVVVAETRRELIKAAFRNIRPGGFYCVIVPRNDQSITSRCVPSTRYRDGYAFRRNGFYTFYKNFRDARAIQQLLKTNGFQQVADLSRYRQICLVAQRPDR